MGALGNVAVGLAGVALAAEAAYAVAGSGRSFLRPPGADDESNFLSLCVKCGRCIQACPYQTLHVAGMDAGAAVGTPMIDALSQACRLCEDFPCVNACPTGALHDIDVRADVNMGLAKINKDECLSFKGMRCEVCYRSCPLIDVAIVIDYRMREGDDIHSIFAPTIVEEDCVGCGLCVERCPVHSPIPAVTIEIDEETLGPRREAKREALAERRKLEGEI